jgi:hypothetical protein
MRAVILTPAYTHIHHLAERTIRISGIPHIELHGHSDLPRARSILIEQGLAQGADVLLLVDADTIPLGAGVLHALADAVTPTRAVWGLYVLRDGDKWSVNPVDPEAALVAIEGGEPFPIRGGGLGVTAIHRESLERLGATLPTLVDQGTSNRWRPFCVPFYRDSVYHADDGSLCARLTETGTELWCHPALRAAHAAETLLVTPRVGTPGTPASSTPR